MTRYIPRTLRTRLIALSLLILMGAVTVAACSSKDYPTQSSSGT